MAEASNTFALHDNLSFEQGSALAIPYLTAYRSLVHHCRARPGQSVLVHGASGAVSMHIILETIFYVGTNPFVKNESKKLF